ncbi:MAG: cyclic nucleotide-binding domain-containing protein [Deltaproteobacteria bacterium]|nr:cyclic nucleotide-binding domain-containing protein [Deltaproteobacteria bacterium]
MPASDESFAATTELNHELVANLLSRIDLFESFPPATLRQVAEVCSTLALDSEQILFQHGSSGSSLFIVAEGALEIFRDDRVIAIVQRDEYIGEIALLDPGVRSASVRAVGPTRLVEVSREVFNNYLSREPEPLTAMMRTIAGRMRGTLDDMQASYEQVNMLVHDMLNLLNVLSGASMVAEGLTPDDDNLRLLELIGHAQGRLETMMREALSKARGAGSSYAKALHDPLALTRECLEQELALHPDIARVGWKLTAQTKLRPCLCNAGDLKRVVANLLINAAQAISSAGNFEIEIGQDSAATWLRVVDDGPGVRAEVLPFIFDTHFTTKRDGNGLGLSSCKRIVEDLHGGSLTCESPPGGKTSFTVTLPG